MLLPWPRWYVTSVSPDVLAFSLLFSQLPRTGRHNVAFLRPPAYYYSVISTTVNSSLPFKHLTLLSSLPSTIFFVSVLTCQLNNRYCVMAKNTMIFWGIFMKFYPKNGLLEEGLLTCLTFGQFHYN